MIKVNLFLLVLIVSMVSALPSQAADKAEIMLMPTRVVMAANEKAATVQLKNTGNATGQFSVSLVDMEMKEDGNVVILDPDVAAPFSATPYLHLSPKSITVKPQQSQTIRILQKRNARKAEPGEYRSHLRVKMENDNVEGTEAAANNPLADTVISVKANLVLIIPVIFRVGETSYSMNIEEPILQYDANGQPAVNMYLAREGNRSAMGDFSISYKPSKGKEKLLTFFPGVPVYRPTLRRFISVPLDVPEGLFLKNGSLEISYSSQEQEGGTILAHTSLILK